jgi:hypothetical protein
MKPGLRRFVETSVLALAFGGCGGETARQALQVELLERVRADQAIRDTVFGRGTSMDPGALRRMLTIDSSNTAWLKQQIRTHGYPTSARVGKAAADAAALIVQHATHDTLFQRQMLDTISAAFARGEVDGQSYALLFDRVTVQAGGRQRYGTQARLVSDALVFDPIEDSSRVDSLRATVGLPPLAVYRRTLDSVYFGGERGKARKH